MSFAVEQGDDPHGLTAALDRTHTSTLRLLDSIIDVSEYWIARWSLSSGGATRRPGGGRRRLRVWRTHTHQTQLHDLAARCARVVDESFAPENRGRGECRVPAAPAASCALVLVERTRVTTSTPESPGIPARNGFNGFLRALPGDRACLPPSSADMFCLSPVGPTQLRELDASVGSSGPHDFAVRCNISRPLPWGSLTVSSPSPPS